MLKRVPIWFLLWLLPLACFADTSTIEVVRADPWATGTPPRVAEVLRHIERKSMGYTVAIDFQALPQPLKPVQATVTVTCDQDTTYLSLMYNLGLEFGFYRDQIEWVGERKVSLGGELKAGDVRTIPIEFTLLQSQGILIISCGSSDGDLVIGWCFDETGTLVHLGISPSICDAFPRAFFEGDSIKILTHGPANPNSSLVDAYYTIVPPFRIGDTSTVCFHITALHSFPEGFDMEFVYDHMSLSGLPEAVKGPIFAGQMLDISIQVVPLPLRDIHELTLRMESGDAGPRKRSNREALSVSALFRDDGSLTYVNHGSILPPEQERLSKSLPAGTRETCGRIRIDRNPDVTEGRGQEGGQ